MTVSPEVVLQRCFFTFRAEQLGEIADLFVRPPYYDKLESPQPCLLFGGRGTGKTTALRYLRFDICETSQDERPYLGVYIKINKNQVSCFYSDRHGPLLARAFAHYFNLLAALELCRLSEHLEGSGVAIGANELLSLSRQLCVAESRSLAELACGVVDAINVLELFVNNIDQDFQEPPRFSIAEASLRTFAALVTQQDLRKRPLFCCIDEYENLLDYQQAILNGYIKHADHALSYKVGLKLNGLRCRDTVTPGDPLITPADYVEVDITEEGAEPFLLSVLTRRLAAARESGVALPDRPDELFPALSQREEAMLLGGGVVASALRDDLRAANDEGLQKWLERTADGDLYLVRYRSEIFGEPVLEIARSFASNASSWRDFRNNYGFQALFWLSRGRRGARIRKYYCGVRTVLMLARGNVRFFLEVLGSGVLDAVGAPSTLSGAVIVVHPKEQTLAARAVGRRQLEQLDGLGARGAEIQRLVLGIGKVFFERTRRPEPGVPEPTSFVLSGSESARAEVEQVLREGVAYLAFLRAPRTKATTDTEIRDDEYSLHPIFAPFFEMSYRRKRRITLQAETLIELQSSPRSAIGKLLEGVSVTGPDELPEQLALFASFYGE